MAGLEDEWIADNVENAVHHRRDKDYDWADRNLFGNEDISRTDVDATNYEQVEHSTNHAQSGFAGTGDALRNSATNSGVSFNSN